MTALQLVASIANLFALLMILSFLRRERLKEKYSLLWLLCILVTQALILSYHWIDRFAAWMGVFYPPSLIFFLAILFLFVMVLHLTLVVSKQNKQIQILAQQLALLEARVSPAPPLPVATDPEAGGPEDSTDPQGAKGPREPQLGQTPKTTDEHG